MATRTTTSTTVRAVVRALLAAVVGVGVLIGAAVAAAPRAGAATGGQVVYSAQINIPAPPASNFAGSAGGDGWGLAFTPTAVYNVFHHQATLQVACHLQTDASACWPAPETIVDGSGTEFASSSQPGLWLDQATGHLFVFATRVSDGTGGVVCIDTTLPASATGAQRFCGFTALTAVGDAPVNSSGISGISDPVVVGTHWYAFNGVNGTVSGTEDTLLCFDLVAEAACGTQPVPVDLGPGTVASGTFPTPSIAAFGSQVVIPVTMSGGDELACVDVSTGGQCAGSWPVSTTALGYPSTSNCSTCGGAPFPVLGATGAVTGFCIPIAAVPCFGLNGASAATPPGMATAVTPTWNWNGPALTLGARVYVPDGNANQVDCYDFVAGASCTNFPKVLSGLSLLYSVNADPQRPSCIWVNSDSGTSQIQNFDAYSGGSCGQGPVRVLAASVVAPFNQCIPTNYTSLQVLVPTPGQYSSGSVHFEDFNGNPIPSIPDQNLDATGSVNLAPLGLSTASPLPQFLITLNNAGSPPEVDVKLTWTGAYSPSCTSGGQQVTGSQGYRLAATDGGVFAFGQAAFYGAMTGKHLNGPEVAIAATPDDAGYWMAASDGGVFAFGDAGFHGSLGGLRLNAPIVGMAASPDGKGYWLVAADGGVFAFGDAPFEGSLGGGGATAPVVGMAASHDGKGYWLVGADGNVYHFGDAAAHGSRYQQPLNSPVVGMAASADGGGYWLVAADGGVFAYGDAPFEGAMTGHALGGAVVGVQPTPSGGGYWLDAKDGGVFAFGDASFLGSMAASPLNAPLVSISS